MHGLVNVKFMVTRGWSESPFKDKRKCGQINFYYFNKLHDLTSQDIQPTASVTTQLLILLLRFLLSHTVVR